MTNNSNVFVSYSWDSDAHRDEVKKFIVDPLRESGINVISDFDYRPGMKIDRFMEREVPKSDKIIVVITPKYAEKMERILRGVTFEEPILSAEMLDGLDSNKVIPVFKNNPNGVVPAILEGRIGVKFDDPDERRKGICEIREAIGNGEMNGSDSFCRKDFERDNSQFAGSQNFSNGERKEIVFKTYDFVRKEITNYSSLLNNKKYIQSKIELNSSCTFSCIVLINDTSAHSITVMKNIEQNRLNGDIYFRESDGFLHDKNLSNGGFLLRYDKREPYWVFDYFMEKRFKNRPHKLNESDISYYIWKILMDNSGILFQ